LAADSGRAKTISELSAPINADPALVARIVRHLAAAGDINETVGTGTYTSAKLSKALALPHYSSGVKICFDTSGRVYASMPSYFAGNGYKNPAKAMDGPWQHAHGPGSAFKWFNERPEHVEALNTYLFAQGSERPSWIDMYPVHDRLIEGLDVSGASSALIDVGGGIGNYLEEFRTKVPEWAGRLVLQEQEVMVNIAQGVGLNSKIEATVYDFFTPQPIKGARAYFLRNILHDWPDDRCRDILSRLKTAMEPGYSKILLNEIVVANSEPHLQHTAMDLQMMAMASGEERTESEWRKLISSVGLQVTGIWSQGQGNESIIEIVK